MKPYLYTILLPKFTAMRSAEKDLLSQHGKIGLFFRQGASDDSKLSHGFHWFRGNKCKKNLEPRFSDQIYALGCMSVCMLAWVCHDSRYHTTTPEDTRCVRQYLTNTGRKWPFRSYPGSGHLFLSTWKSAFISLPRDQCKRWNLYDIGRLSSLAERRKKRENRIMCDRMNEWMNEWMNAKSVR